MRYETRQNAAYPPIAAISVALGVASTAFATNWYVSSDGSWDPEGAGKTRTTITSAIKDASPEDTIWVKNNFVCTNETATSKDGSKNNLVIDKAVTVRSEFGYVDEANDVWAKICGRYNSASSPCGDNGTRCVYMTTGATLVGFVLESGATSDYNHGSYPGGGAIYGVGTVSNCVIRNCWGTTGGAIRNKSESLSSCLVLENCIITNNIAKYYGSGAAGVFEMHRCNVFCNQVVSGSSGEGGTLRGFSNSVRARIFDCGVSNNTVACSSAGNGKSGGLFYVNAFGSSIVSNSVSGSGGGAYNCALSHCLVLGNHAIANGANGGFGGGLYVSTATNCIIMLNRLSGGTAATGYGAGGYNCDFVNCQVISNKARTCAYTDFRPGTGLYCTAVHSCYNTLFIGNNTDKGVAAVSSSDASKKVRLVNCTITGNTSGNGVGGCYNAVMVNTICQGNTGSGQIGGTIVATNSCAKGLSDTAKYPGCITTDPKFIGTGDHPYALSSKSPCRDKGFYDKDDPAWNWMTDPADPRSKDLAGKPRLQGTAPDMGCYEFVPPGFLLLLR